MRPGGGRERRYCRCPKRQLPSTCEASASVDSREGVDLYSPSGLCRSCLFIYYRFDRIIVLKSRERQLSSSVRSSPVSQHTPHWRSSDRSSTIGRRWQCITYIWDSPTLHRCHRPLPPSCRLVYHLIHLVCPPSTSLVHLPTECCSSILMD